MTITWQMPMNDEIVLVKELEALKEQHRELDDEIATLDNGPWDELRMARLKKEKLRLRDKIYAIESELYPDMPA